jgi:multidrug efflux pump subunit AcrB
VDELNLTLLMSAILTSFVCYFFLGSWSSTFNVLLAIPTSIVGAFIALYFFGFTLNSFTLLGLSLAIGIVVDDAIMMLENIVRHHEMGKNRRQAALDGSLEITFAAIATTLAIAAIFVPVIFMQGVVGRFFYQYGITVTVAVFLSLLEALTLTPMRCARFLHTAKEGNPGWVLRTMDRFMERLSHRYKDSLTWCLQHRGVIVIISIVVFALSLVFMFTLKKELIPPQDQSMFLLNIKTPVGNSIDAANDVFIKAEAYLKSQPEVTSVYSTVGNYNNNNVVNAGTIYVILNDPKKRKFTQQDMMAKVSDGLRGLLGNDTEVFAQDLSLTGFSASRGYPVEFVIEGPDWTKLVNLSTIVLAKIKATGLVRDLNVDFQEGMPELLVIPDRNRSADRGVSVSMIGQEVSNMIGGQLFSANTEYPEAGHRYYIRLRSETVESSTPEDLNRVLLRNNRGDTDLVALDKTATVKVAKGPQLISRVNRFRAIPAYANMAPGKSQQDALEAIEKIAVENMPPGYHLTVTGSAQAFREAFQSLFFALILGVVVAYMVLASQFNSFIHPITVLMALPFSLSGALVALYLCHQSLSLFSMIGLILLMGIVKKNSILLVDFTNQRRAEGLEPTAALLEACPVRLRPILMTSVATVAGAVPEALNFGAGAETRVPMAISIIGGVMLSTLLTLYVVPCVYSLFSRFERPEVDDIEVASGVHA